MAVIYQTDLKPTKLELLAHWLPSRPWYRDGGGEPELARAGGFRLDDPQGAVGIEFLVVTDASGAAPTTYLVPFTYRGAPLAGAEHALVGTMEHGVLGRRWVYDGCHDPVLLAQLLALMAGRVLAQDQNISDTLDQEVIGRYTGDDLNVPEPTTAAIDHQESTELAAPPSHTLTLQRVLRPARNGSLTPVPEGAGTVTGSWQTPDGGRAHGLFAVLRATSGVG